MGYNPTAEGAMAIELEDVSVTELTLEDADVTQLTLEDIEVIPE